MKIAVIAGFALVFIILLIGYFWATGINGIPPYRGWRGDSWL